MRQSFLFNVVLEWIKEMEYIVTKQTYFNLPRNLSLDSGPDSSCLTLLPACLMSKMMNLEKPCLNYFAKKSHFQVSRRNRHYDIRSRILGHACCWAVGCWDGQKNGLNIDG
jgi:hypothetical protein